MLKRKKEEVKKHSHGRVGLAENPEVLLTLCSCNVSTGWGHTGGGMWRISVETSVGRVGFIPRRLLRRLMGSRRERRALWSCRTADMEWNTRDVNNLYRRGFTWPHIQRQRADCCEAAWANGLDRNKRFYSHLTQRLPSIEPDRAPECSLLCEVAFLSDSVDPNGHKRHRSQSD